MNGSQSWGDYPPAPPLFVPSRLELMRNAPNWCPWMQDVTDAVLDDADFVRDDHDSPAISDEDKEYFYDKFIARLLFNGYSDQTIYEAQMEWIRGETERMERENNTKEDADE